MGTTIKGEMVITETNYNQTHGCEAFTAYVEEFGAEFLERRSSGVYVVRANRQIMSGIASFAGFDAVQVGDQGVPVWVVRRGAVRVVDFSC